jgi:NitT/TauT family transport system substrate-binding protein
MIMPNNVSINRRGMLAGAGGAIAASMVPNITRAQTLDTVNIGHVIGISEAPFFIGDAKGFFRDAGVDVKWTVFEASAQMIAPLAQGQLDGLGSGISAATYNAIGRGIPLRIVGDRGIDFPPYGALPLVVRTDLIKSGRFKTLQDLKGLKIAEPTKGGANLTIVTRFLEKAGLKYEDADHLFLPFAEQLAAFRNGALDASVLIEPFASLAISQGYVTKVGVDTDAYPNHQISVLFYSAPFMEKRPDVARKFFVGYLRALRYYRDALLNGKLAGPNAEDVIAIMQKNLSLPDPSLWRSITPTSVTTDGRVNMASVKFEYDTFNRFGFITDPSDISRAVDMRFADYANRQLGPYRAQRS